MRITREHSLGLIVDIQERLLPHIHNHEVLERNTILLIRGLQILKVPLTVTEQYPKGLGGTVEPVKKWLETDEFIEKTAFSCCDEPRFAEKLNLMSKRFVMIAGIEAHVCVLQTALDLLANGYQPVVVTDCVGSRKEGDRDIALRRMIQEKVLLTTTESILFELARVSGTDAFKAISRLVK
ncbi:MAG TPA: hydrolase [Bacteroidetes bacterium]|nr:hydrolase [Bacteroidota bacterium]